jgi:dTDP-glucose 4,6-dehydratase
LLVTGGAGFIGSSFARSTLSRRDGTEVLVLDALTYAGNLENLAPVANLPGFEFERLDVRDAQAVRGAFERFRPEAVLHCAAESHVDRSILSPTECVSTNTQGTAVLLEAAREYPPRAFVQVSTDEVYGSIDAPSVADEASPLRPSSPYSASKAGSDLLALAYAETFSLPVIVTRASNNYGPYQFPEKLIPLMIANALDDVPLPLYGDGMQVRDWLHVEDHCRAITALIEKGKPGEIYNVGGNCPLPNIEVVRRILRLCGRPETLIEHVPDRPAHDRRYALASSKIESETGWTPAWEFDAGLRETIRWYRRNPGWVERVRSGEYLRYYNRNYSWRGAATVR